MSGTTLGTKDSVVPDFIGLSFSLKLLHLKGGDTGASSSEVKAISGGLCLQQLEAGFQFLARGLGLVIVVNRVNPSH